MFDHLREVNQLQQKGMNFPAQPPGEYQLGLGEEFPFISAYIETLPCGLIADEI